MTIHYHGTPITPTVRLNDMSGAHFCVSYAARQQVEHCHKIGQSVMLDNGAFSVWRRGIAPDWPGYYDWADRWLDYPTTWAVIPDEIEGGEVENDALLTEWPHGDHGAPVWHMHESIPRLLRLLDEWPRVCIGSSGQYAVVLSGAWERRMDAAWREISARHSRAPNIHMLRGLQLVRHRWPFASVDSTDIARNHSAPQNDVGAMRSRWDACQCPSTFHDPGEQLELVA